MSPKMQNIYSRLRRHRIILDNECWIWTGKLDRDGYGHIVYYGKDIGVHRLAAHLYRGLSLDSTLLVCHKDICPNKSCFNPEHTFDGTYSDNNTKKLCDRGHDNWYINPRTKKRYCKTCIKNTRSQQLRKR